MKSRNFFSKYKSTKDFITNSWFLFLFPAALFYVVYFLLPIPLSFYYSFFKMSGLGDMVFIGLSNWSKMISNEIFWTAFQHNIMLLFGSLAVQIPLALGLAILIKSKLLKGSKIFKVSYFIPRLFSATAVGIIWQYIFNTNFGSLNTILRTIGLGHLAQAWLSEFSMLSVFIVFCWNAIPFYMIILLAALGNIPDYLYEAASIDGANSWESFLHITLPSLKPTILTVSILIIVGSLKQFALVYVMTLGGPSRSSELMSTYMFKEAFVNYNFGYASTIALSMFIFIFLVVLGMIWFTGKTGKSREVI